DQTILKWSSGSGCIGWYGLLGLGACANQEWLGITDEVLDGVSWTTQWTGTTEGGAGNYPKGSTHLTVASTANMAAGRLVWLDQVEETVDDGGVANSDHI